jgi:hypothetical protein
MSDLSGPIGDLPAEAVEAAAKAIDKELADSATGPLYIAHLDFFPERAARQALAAADEADRAAGRITIDTRDDATFKLIRRACNDPGQFLPRGEQYDGEPNTLGHWQAMAVVAALAAAGAQEETHD